ncbi:MAG: RNA polymerase sigma factor [Candidatus Liptonbacteria bacterium]|nr:RNA polymerase sigma factor [Candidatus Liptonbacteria bacterium]
MSDRKEKDKFLEIYDSYSDAIYRHCYFRVFSKERAEELVQETFVRAWQYIAGNKDIENMRALLYRIATNLIIDDSRKRKEESLEAMIENEIIDEPGDKGHIDMERNVLWKQVFEEMKALDNDDRQVLIMRFVDDLDPREIAEILETSANNVSVRINRAVKKLKTKINESY